MKTTQLKLVQALALGWLVLGLASPHFAVVGEDVGILTIKVRDGVTGEVVVGMMISMERGGEVVEAVIRLLDRSIRML